MNWQNRFELEKESARGALFVFDQDYHPASRTVRIRRPKKKHPGRRDALGKMADRFRPKGR